LHLLKKNSETYFKYIIINPVNYEVTLEDALNDGTIVALTFNVNGTDITSSLKEEHL
jgi:hypothetical protein